MRVRYRSVTYRYIEGSQEELERRYHQLWHELVRQSQQQILLHRPSLWRPPADIHETPDAITVKIELAGMREDKIDVTLYQDALVVSGERHDDHEHDETIWYQEAQIRYGPFRVEIFIPQGIDGAKVEAHYDDGFLRVLLPKAAASESQQASPYNRAADQQPPVSQQHAPDTRETRSSTLSHSNAPTSRILLVSSKGDSSHA